MNRIAVLLYFLLLASTSFSTKFVLTTIGFRYPMVFQGWQTLVGFLLYRLLHALGFIKIASIDLSGFISLFPAFLFFTAAILTGSMALSQVPVAAFVSVSCLVQVGAFALADRESRKKVGSAKAYRFRLGACLVVTLANVLMLLTEQTYSKAEGYFWLEMHCLCSVGLVLYGRIMDARFNSIDRQYYCYVFSLIVLLPASLYLNEAFEALNFPKLYQLMFIGGSLVCAISAMALTLCQSRLRNEKKFGAMHHGGLMFVAVLSLFVFELEFFTLWSIALALISIGAQIFLPTHMLPEVGSEEDQRGIMSSDLLSSI